MKGWQTRAGCAGADPSLFDPKTADETAVQYRRRTRQAAEYCRACPVKTDCAAAAKDPDNPIAGVHAGIIPPVARTREPAKCGTAAGYARHRRHNEQPCPACTDAHTLETRHYRRTKPA